MMLRRGMTMIEILVVSAVAVIVLTALITLSTSSSKLSKAALSSAMLQNALLIEESVAADIRQLGVLPGLTINFAPHGLSFYRCVFDAKQIRYRPVKYGCERTRGGNLRLVRTEAGPAGLARTQLDGLLSRCEFSNPKDPVLQGWGYLKITLTLIDEDVAPGPSSAYSARQLTHDVLCRIPFPSELGNTRLQKTTRPLVERDLLPLD